MVLDSKLRQLRKNIQRNNSHIRDCDLANFSGLSLPELHFWMRLYLNEEEHFYECTLSEARQHKMGRSVSYMFYYAGALTLLKYLTRQDFKRAVLGMRLIRLSVLRIAKRRVTPFGQ